VGAVALSGPSSLIISLYSDLVLGVFQGLIDSGSSDCLLDSSFVAAHNLLFRTIEPRPLTLIDGTVNQNVDWIVTLPIQLTCSYSCVPEFFVMQLDGSSLLVLEYNWLQAHNPGIDWSKGTLNLPVQGPEDAVIIKKHPTNNPREPSCNPQLQPSISLINAVAYQRACKAPGAQSFQLTHTALNSWAAHMEPISPELSEVPTEYHQFADVFDKQCSSSLPLHHPHDLAIWIEENSLPPLGPIYSLLALELQMLREFIKDNVKIV